MIVVSNKQATKSRFQVVSHKLLSSENNLPTGERNSLNVLTDKTLCRRTKASKVAVLVK